MTRPFTVEMPPRVAASVRRLPTDVKKSVREAIRALAHDPDLGLFLVRELEGLSRYRVRRYRIVYEVDRRRRRLRVMAVGHRREVYETL